MNTYNIKIIERLEMTVSIAADNAESAEDKIRTMYRNCEIVLTVENYVDTDFIIENDNV